MTTKSQRATSSQIKNPEEQPDFSKFVELLQTTKQLTTEYDDLSPEQQNVIKNKYWIWDKQGKPDAQMPELTQTEDVVFKVYREKKLGKQYLYWIDGVGKEHDRDTEYEYGTIAEFDEKGQPTGKNIEDRSTVTKTTKIPRKMYTKGDGEDLLERAFRTHVNPKFYFVRGSLKFALDDPETEFNGDFDEYMKTAKVRSR